MPAAAVAGATVAGAANVSGGLISGYLNKKYSEELAEQSYQLGQKAQVNAASNTVSGFQRAGLSPALAANGNFSPAAGISGPMGNTDAKPNVDLAQAVSIDKQNELLDAQIANVNAQTQAVNNQNKAWSDEDQAVGEYAKVMASKWQNTTWYDKLLPETQQTIDNIATGSEKLTIGRMRALISAIESQGKLSDTEYKQISNGFNAEVFKAKFADPDVFRAEVQKALIGQNYTQAQIAQIAGTLSKYQAEIVELLTRGELNRGTLAVMLADNAGYNLKSGDWAQYGKLKLNKFIDGCLGAVTFLLPMGKVGKGVKALEGLSKTAGKRLAGNKAYNKSALKMFDNNSSAIRQLDFGKHSGSNFVPGLSSL